MPDQKDLLALIEILTTAIEIHGNEEDFFRRSSSATTNGAAKTLLLEIADEVGRDRKALEEKRRELSDELYRLHAAETRRSRNAG